MITKEQITIKYISMQRVVISYSKPSIIVFTSTYSKHTQNSIKPMENVSAFQKIIVYGQYICSNMPTSSEAVVWNVYTDKWNIKNGSIDYFELNVPGCFCCPTKTHTENISCCGKHVLPHR